MNSFLRANAGLLVWLVIFGGGALILCFAAYLMRARGLSLKPIWWFAGFIFLIGFPQLVYHAFTAISKTRTTPEFSNTRIDNAESLFTIAPEGASVVDIQPQMAAGFLQKARRGRFITLSTGDTVMIALFASVAEAKEMVGEYLRESGLESNAQEDDDGFIVPGTGDRFAHVYATGNVLVVQTSASGLRNPPVDPMKTLTASTSGKIVLATGLLVYTLLVSAYFLKGLAWVTRVDAKPAERVLSASELRDRLLAMNSLDIPFRIEVADDGRLSATWRYADAKWVDLARAHGMRRMHRVVMNLEEVNRKVRATDFQSSHDWSAGSGGANFSWKASTGIVLFHYEHERVFGLRPDDRGAAAPEISYAYTFDLQEMKSPLVETVTRAGWRWQPVAWQGPKWLRWFTE